MVPIRTAPLAPYACRPETSRGRLLGEPESPTRSCFQRDRDRVIHSGAFRKLQYKTQVFIYHEGDYYRTRLTHSLEVAQIARSISRQLGLDEDLAEALALAHDLGHTCFGHAGEEALNQAMVPYGGFDHNEQTFRILTQIEQRYATFDGLNLTWETLEGIVKHNGPVIAPSKTVAEFSAGFDLELESYASAEAQVAALADDIAYNNHDVDDGLRAGLFTVDDLAHLPMVGEMFREVSGKFGDLEQSRLIHETIRRLINLMVNDLLATSRANLKAAAPGSAEEIRALGHPVVAFSGAMRQNDRALRDFLFEQMYRHEKVNREMARAKQIVAALFEGYFQDLANLPEDWHIRARELDQAARARLIADYIAGMTDRFAFAEHARLYGDVAESL